MQFKGTVFRYGRDIDTDVIIPARYLNTSDPAELAKHCLEDLDKTFVERVKPGDIVVADENFGCGSSREHAPVAIKAAGVSCVIAKSFARIFYRNSINMGLPILECPEALHPGNHQRGRPRGAHQEEARPEGRGLGAPPEPVRERALIHRLEL